MKTYECKRGHGFFKGKQKETDTIGTIDTGIQYQHTVVGVETKMKIKNATKQGYLEAEDGDGIDISSRMQYHRGTVQKQMAQTLCSSGGGVRSVREIKD